MSTSTVNATICTTKVRSKSRFTPPALALPAKRETVVSAERIWLIGLEWALLLEDARGPIRRRGGPRGS